MSQIVRAPSNAEIILRATRLRAGDALIPFVATGTQLEFCLHSNIAPIDGDGDVWLTRPQLEQIAYRFASFRQPARLQDVDPALYIHPEGRMYIAVGQEVTRVIVCVHYLRVILDMFTRTGVFYPGTLSEPELSMYNALHNAIRLSEYRAMQRKADAQRQTTARELLAILGAA